MPAKVRKPWRWLRQAPAWALLVGVFVAATAFEGSARTATGAADPVSIDVAEAITAADGPSALPPATAESSEGITAMDAVSVLLAEVPAAVAEGVSVADTVSVVQAQTPAAVAEGITVADAVSVVPGQGPVAVAERVTVADAVRIQPQSPTAVAIRSFSAQRSRRGVVLRWRSASEVDLLGFDLYRSRGGVGVKLNRHLIRAKASGTTAGANYRLLDRRARPGHRYVYRLEHVLRTGERASSRAAVR